MTSNFPNMIPFAAMVVSSFSNTGMKVISKAAVSRGISSYVFVVYSTAICALLILPPLFFSVRLDRNRPPLTFLMLGKFFALSLIGITLCSNLGLNGIKYSSPTLGAAIGNLDPAIVFMLAVIFRIEKLNIKSLTSQIKILGTIVSVLGALIMTLYRGPTLWASMPSEVHRTSVAPQTLHPLSDWVIGGFCFVLGSFSFAGSNILQASVLKVYPFEATVVFFSFLIGTLQTAAISLVLESDLNAWKLKFDFELVALVCVAFCVSLSTYIQAWCIAKKGPVFVALFGPLGIVITAPISMIFLGDSLYVGSVVGAVIIVSGFYAVIWAQSKDIENDQQCLDHLPASSYQKIPLLPDHQNRT